MYVEENNGHPFITGMDSGGVYNMDQLRKNTKDLAQEVLGRTFNEPPMLIDPPANPHRNPECSLLRAPERGRKTVGDCKTAPPLGLYALTTSSQACHQEVGKASGRI